MTDDSDWDVPTEASPVIPGSVFPLDRALEGATELLGAQPVGLPVPEDEGVKPSTIEGPTIDDLFGETQFVEYHDEPLIPVLPPRASSALAIAGRTPGTERPATEGGGLQRPQKILLWVAIALLAALAFVALFLIAMRVTQNASANPVVEEPPPTAAASAEPSVGPASVGEHWWDDLRGGECLGAFESAWQDTYEVVDCADPHAAQLVFSGLFADAADAPYPGVDELQERTVPLCSAPTVIDYAAAGGTAGLTISASFAANDADWAAGNRAFHCFVSGAELSTSLTVPAQ